MRCTCGTRIVGVNFCMFTEMSTTLSMNCSLMNLHGFSGRLGQLESACATSLAQQSSCQCAASVGSRSVQQTVCSLPGSGFLLCTFILMILCFFISTVFSTPVIIWLTSPDGFSSLRGALDDLRLLHLHCVDDVFGRSFDLIFLRICGMLHLHCVDDWLDLCVHNLFNGSLDPVMRLSAVGTVCSQLAA